MGLKSRAGVLVVTATMGWMAATAGCSLLVSTDELAGNAGNADSGGPEVASDVLVAPDTAPADANVEAAVPGSLGCAGVVPAPRFCADFDKGVLTDYGRVSNGAPSLDTAVALSAPRSLLAVVELQGPPSRQTSILKDFLDTPTSFDLAFDAHVSSYDATHDVELMFVRVRKTPTQSCVFTVSIRHGSWSFDESCDDGATSLVNLAHDTTVRSTLARWTHVSLNVSFLTRTYSIKIDDESVSGKPLDAKTFSGAPTLLMGIAYLQTTATARAAVNFDNVVFDYP
jgi:hypothetical protein